jgi:hypothetical protein
MARAMAPRRNKLGNFAGRSGRVAALLVVVAIARYDSSSRLAPHPATAAKLPNLSLRGAYLVASVTNAILIMPTLCAIAIVSATRS